jgi:hypothetical protein
MRERARDVESLFAWPNLQAAIAGSITGVLLAVHSRPRESLTELGQHVAIIK